MQRVKSVSGELYQKLAERQDERDNVIATVVEGRYAGEKLFLSGGEVVWVSKNGAVLSDRKQQLMNFTGAGLLEGRDGRIFCENPGRRPLLVICGAGHVSLSVIRLGKSIGFYTIVLEDREAFSENARWAGADEVFCEPFETGMERIRGTPDTYFVIVTRGHRYDTICLRLAVQKENAYVGMMGSRKRVGIVKEQLLSEGADAERLRRVHMPIGLSIGAETPEEIAISIMAEIIQVKSSDGRSEGYTEEMLSYLTGERAEEKQKVLAVIIARRGSAPRKTGTKMLILEDGLCVGTIGGGYAEAAIKRESLRMMAYEEIPREIFTVNMTGEKAQEAGMVCGGTIEVYLEKL